jgi:hypothetical protein
VSALLYLIGVNHAVQFDPAPLRSEIFQEAVTEDEKKVRAGEIAEALSDNARWHSHGRAISRDTLRGELRLRIDGVEDVNALNPALDEYVGLLKDYMSRGQFQTFVNTREYF